VGKRENDTGIFDEERNTLCWCAKFQDWKPMHFAVFGLLVWSTV